MKSIVAKLMIGGLLAGALLAFCPLVMPLVSQALAPPAVNQPEIAHIVGRDPVRTPMQWDGGPNAGFAPAKVLPWLPVAAD